MITRVGSAVGPDFARGVDDELQLPPLRIFADVVAVDGAGEAALRAETEVLENSLGNALTNLGANGINSQALRDGIAAYRAALEVRTRAAAPDDWAATQNNLGTALLMYGSRGDDASLRDAIAAFRSALEVFTRAAEPGEWALTQHNLGIALHMRAEFGDDASLPDAIAAFYAALEVRTRATEPVEWAVTQYYLGLAHRTAVLRGDRSQLPAALAAARLALEGFEQIHDFDSTVAARRLIIDLERR